MSLIDFGLVGVFLLRDAHLWINFVTCGNLKEGSTMIESILPIAVEITLVGLALIGIRELLHEFGIACKGGFQ